MDYEVVIPAAEKDYNKLNYLLSSLHYLNPQPKRVNIIHNSETLFILRLNDPWKVLYFNEKEVLDLDPNAAKLFRRPPWIYQQFLKLFQNVTSTNWYLVLDSDIILNKQIDLLDKNGKPKFFLGNDQNHKPYFRYSQDMFGFGREYNHSFISEIMLFDKRVCNVLIAEYHYHMGKQDDYGTGAKDYHQRKYMSLNFSDADDGRLESINEIYKLTCMGATDAWIPADYEIYGNFVYKTFPMLYSMEKIKTSMRGKYNSWTDEELESYIEEMKGTDYDTFTAHTWI